MLKLVFLVFFSNHINSQYIVDTKSPIVIQDDRGGAGNNFFGYSLTFIKGQFGNASYNPSSPFHGTLFIGAPKENKSDARNSGIVWGCNFYKNASIICSPLTKISNKEPVSQPSCSREKTRFYPESESDQWIGASLTTTDQQLYACAPRWKMNGFEYSSNGHCRDFTALSGACYKGTSAETTPTVLGPFYKAVTAVTFWYLYTQFGFSSHATQSGNLVFGTPSSASIGYTNYWECRGTYMEYLPGSGKRLLRHKDTECYAYLGYSVSSGRTRNKREYVAVGAPRGKNFFGSVLINYFGSNSPNLRVIGEQFGAYFGYSLATADINGDGDDELLVGAPFFTNEFNTEHNFNGGCVFVYDVDTSSERIKQLQKLCLDDEPKGARFGSAIAKMGDINFDKKEDFAVAAPYHWEGIGTVFIYYGGFPLSNTRMQTIKGTTMGIPNLKGFGTYLLSGNVDVDGNGTPDLVISSFESNNVVVLRTRPVATASIKVTFHSSNSHGDEGNINQFTPTRSASAFRVRICNSFEFSVAVPENFTLDCRIKFEIDKRTELNARPLEYEIRHNFFSISETCIDEILNVKSDFVEENSKTPYQFRAGLTYNISDTELIVSQPVPIKFSQRQESDIAFSEASKSFREFHPANISTTWSALEELEVAEDNCNSDGNQTCDPNLTLDVETLYEYQNYTIESRNVPFLIGQVETLLLKIYMKNSGETAYRPNVKVSLRIMDDNFEVPKTKWHWRLTEPSKKVENFPDSPNTNSIHSLISGQFTQRSRPLHYQTENFYELKISNWGEMKVKEKLSGELQVKIEAFPEDQEEDEKVEWNNTIQLEANINIEVEPVAGTEGQSDINPMTNRVDLSQIYVVRNTGPSSIAAGHIKAEIFVPTHVNVNGNLTQVIGIVDPSRHTSQLRCETHDFSFYRLGDSSPSIHVPTVSEEVLSVPLSLQLKTEQNESSKTPTASDKTVTLSGCSPNKPSAHCRQITCYTDLPPRQSRSIRIHMHVLPDTLKDLISSESTGIQVDTSITVTYLKNVTKTTGGTTTRKFSMELGIPAWMVIAAGAGGLILLMLIILALYKCGFFKRKVKKDLRTLKRQTQMWMELNDMEVPWLQNENGDNKRISTKYD